MGMLSSSSHLWETPLAHSGLQKITELLRDDPHIADKLKLADVYMGQFHRMGKRDFVLPREHAWLHPLIDNFAHDLPKFVEYVRMLREEVPKRSEQYISLHELYRTLRVRCVQQERRERLRRALTWFEKKHPTVKYEQKMKWLRKVEQQWGRERMKAMEVARRSTSRGRLTTDEREQVLDEFWMDIDEIIKQGDLPPL